jgi:hypothetical protein
MADKFQKLEIKKDVLLSCVIPDDVTRRPNMAAHGEGKVNALHLSAKNGTENTASCMERQNDECWNKEENQNEKHRGSDSQSQVEMGRPRGTNGPAQIGTRYISVGRKNRQKGGDLRPDGKTRSREQNSGTKSQKLELME